MGRTSHSSKRARHGSASGSVDGSDSSESTMRGDEPLLGDRAHSKAKSTWNNQASPESRPFNGDDAHGEVQSPQNHSCNEGDYLRPSGTPLPRSIETFLTTPLKREYFWIGQTTNNADLEDLDQRDPLHATGSSISEEISSSTAMMPSSDASNGEASNRGLKEADEPSSTNQKKPAKKVKRERDGTGRKNKK